jgi:hypothetical protein
MNEKPKERLYRRKMPLFELFIWVFLFGSAALTLFFTNHILSSLMSMLKRLEEGGLS